MNDTKLHEVEVKKGEHEHKVSKRRKISFSLSWFPVFYPLSFVVFFDL